MNIKDVKQWICWDFRDGRKVPLNKYGEPSGSTHDHDYVTFDEAFEASERLGLQGPAFCFTEEDEFVGIDLDDCLVDLAIKPWGRRIVDAMSDCYCEISPSLTGLKIFARGKIPPGYTSQTPCEGGAIEVYEKGRFFAFTGLHVDGTGDDAADADLEWLFAAHWRPTDFAPRTPAIRTISGSMFGLRERALDYVANADRPLSGERNNALFRLAGHLLSIDCDGQRLGVSEVTELCHGWNESLQQPLPAVEVGRVVASASKNGTPRQAKVDEFMPEDVEPVRMRVSKPTETDKTDKKPTKPTMPDDFPVEVLGVPGLIGDYVQHAMANAMYPLPQSAFAGALSLLAAITGRKVQDNRFGTRTNIYTICVAPSGAGKEYARGLNKRLLSLGMINELCGPERIGSHAGLISHLKKSPATLFQLDEIGKLLESIKGSRSSPHLANIITVLMQIFTSSNRRWIGDAYADTDRTPEVQEPHAVVYGTTTPATFYDGLSRGNVTDGFLGRCMVFEDSYVPLNADPKPDLDPPRELIDRVRAWGELRRGGNMGDDAAVPPPVTAVYMDDAFARLRGHIEAISTRRLNEGEEAAAIWSRTTERTAKLALLFACSRQTPDEDTIVITKADVNLAIRLSNYLTRRTIRGLGRIAMNETERTSIRVLEVIRDHAPIGRSDLTRRTQWLRKRERNEVIEGLLDAGLIRVAEAESPEGSKPKLLFFLNEEKGGLNSNSFQDVFKDVSRYETKG